MKLAPIAGAKVRLVDARGLWIKMSKSLDDKRKTISEAQAKEIVELYAGFIEGEQVKIFPNEADQPMSKHI